MPTFYHYTDDDGAKLIIRPGTIQASLKDIRTGDAAFGNGVYLTKLSPQTSTKDEIALNNWTRNNATTQMKLKNYFILNIPESDIKNTNATNRNIFLFGFGKDLRLHKYSWVLKDYDSGRIITSYKYRVSSTGPASANYKESMGDYRMTDDIMNGMPMYKGPKTVYKGVHNQDYLFISSRGNWIIFDDVSSDNGHLVQMSTSSCLGPERNQPWEYYDEDQGASKIDYELTVKPYGNPSFNFDEVEELV